MRNRYLVCSIQSYTILAALIIMSVLISGCSQVAASESDAVAATEPTANRPAPTAIPETADPAPTAETLATEVVVDDMAAAEDFTVSQEDLIALGETIFQETAGGIGCQACHGRDGKGDIGPDIRGKSFETIMIQLESNEAMAFIILSVDEVEALAAYLDWLEKQP